MNILIVGSGGREYSIALALKKDTDVNTLFFAPGNGATDKLGVNICEKDFEKLADIAQKEKIDLTIVGPEAPLVEGIVDVFRKRGLVIFGASKAAAKLEGSKAYMKDFLIRHNIPTARYIQTSLEQEAYEFINTLNTPIVVKADGLCGGKGVIIAQTKNEAKSAIADMLNGKSFGDAGKCVVVEEFLDGYELSIFAICDGEHYKILPAAQDHKRLEDNDCGPNTGGMGAYAPTPLANEDIYNQIEEFVVKPTLKGMKEEGVLYTGVLFIGAMVVDKKVYVLEYNVRFGDPECEVLMPLLDTLASELFYKAATGRLNEIDLKFKNEVAVGVVMASKEYPYSNSTSDLIKVGSDSIKNAHVVYAGVSKKDGKLYTNGGRILLCVGLGKNVQEAQKNAYLLTKEISFDGAKFRKDIAYQAMR